MINEEDYKYALDTEVLIMEEKDNPNLLRSFMKDYKVIRGIAADKYYFWSAMITHYDMAEALKIKAEHSQSFIIEYGHLSNEYLQVVYDEVEENGITKEDIEDAKALKRTYDRLKAKFGLTYEDLEDEEIMNDICNGKVPIFENLSEFFKSLNKQIERYL